MEASVHYLGYKPDYIPIAFSRQVLSMLLTCREGVFLLSASPVKATNVPLRPRPDNWAAIRRVVAVYGTPLDKHGRLITGAKPMWSILPRWAHDLYEELARLGGKDGQLWPSYQWIALRMKVTPERARQQVQALCNWGFLQKQHRTREHGWFDSNLYALLDPLAPTNLLAVAVFTYDREHPHATMVVSKQAGAIPEYRTMRRSERPPVEREAAVPPTARTQTPAPALILREVYRKIAEAEGLIDPRLQHEAWRRYQAAIKNRNRKMKKPGAYWRGVVRNVLAECQDQQGAVEPPRETPVTTPQDAKVTNLTEHERHGRRQFIVLQAYRELMAGGDPGKVAAVIFAMPQLNRYCRFSECALEDVAELVLEAYRSLHPGT